MSQTTECLPEPEEFPPETADNKPDQNVYFGQAGRGVAPTVTYNHVLRISHIFTICVSTT
jgi:hypothetical protein